MVETVWSVQMFEIDSSSSQQWNSGGSDSRFYDYCGKTKFSGCDQVYIDWSRNLEVVLVAIFSSTVTAAVLQFILGWSRNLEVVPTKTTRLYGEVVTTIRSISTLSSEKEMHMGSFSLHSMVPLHLIFGMLVD
jgi:hypothetical protein